MSATEKLRKLLNLGFNKATTVDEQTSSLEKAGAMFRGMSPEEIASAIKESILAQEYYGELGRAPQTRGEAKPAKQPEPPTHKRKHSWGNPIHNEEQEMPWTETAQDKYDRTQRDKEDKLAEHQRQTLLAEADRLLSNYAPENKPRVAELFSKLSNIGEYKKASQLSEHIGQMNGDTSYYSW